MAGLTVTGFSGKEEDMVGLRGKVDYVPEDIFREQGAKYESADPWNPKACRDGHIITGQNPQSSEATAKLIVEALK